MFQRSAQNYKLRYTEYSGERDSSSFDSVAKDEPYGPGVTINRLECVGHVQKRLGTALWKLKQPKSKILFSDDK